MKIGNKVKVIELTAQDKSSTNLKINDVGIIASGSYVNNGRDTDVFYVRFSDSFEVSNNDSNNADETGAYAMLRSQLEEMESIEDGN